MLGRGEAAAAPSSGLSYERTVSFAILGVDFLRANKLLVDVSANSLVDSSTGDRFRLTGQPSGHTASIMLPANTAIGAPEPAPQGATSGTTGRPSYAAVAAGPATRSFTPAAARAAPLATRVAGPMPTTIPAILDLFQVVLNTHDLGLQKQLVVGFKRP